jgi:hypothetical protein
MSFTYEEPLSDDKLKMDGAVENVPSTRAIAVEDRDPVPEYTESDAETLFAPPALPPAHVTLKKLDLPVVLPQVNTDYDSAFLRAYNPVLADSGVTEEDWLTFIDGLNIAIVCTVAPSPILSCVMLNHPDVF